MRFDHKSMGSDSLERAKKRLKRQIAYLFLFFVAVIVAQRYIDRQLFGDSSLSSQARDHLDHEVSVGDDAGDKVSTMP